MLAIAVAVLGLVFMQDYLEKEKTKAQNSMEKIAVLTAKTELKEGDPLKSESLSFRMVAKADQHWSTIQLADPDQGADARRQYEDIRAVLHGRILARTVKENEILGYQDFREPPAERLSLQLKDGQRGLAVTVDTASLMGGLLQPNDRVDVLATFPAGISIRGGASEPYDKTMVILTDITVYAVGGRMARMEGGTSTGSGATVVLALNPDQALKLSHVQKSATKISLLLRPSEAVNAGNYASLVVNSADVQENIEKMDANRQAPP